MPWWDCGHLCRSPDTDDIVCLDYNHLSLMEVPSEIFSYERTLEDLYLECNRITDLPRQLFHCHGLKTLNLSDNEITLIPAAISALVNLQWLDLSKNSLTTLPETIKNCTNLTYLNVSLNPIEKLCDPLMSAISLIELHLNDIYLEFLPANFGRLTNLKILELRENNLITLPKSMNRLINLTRLDIGQNEFTDLPEVVCTLINLTELWIDSNRIRRLPSNVGELRKLIHFDASNNMLQTLPRQIGYWTKVVEFCVTNNDIVEIPSTIGNMKNLKGLKLDENRIQVLPDSIGKLNNLEELILSHNDIFVLPESIGLLRKLQMLSVDKNLLTNLPTEIGSCNSLRVLSLRSNRLSYIPAELGHLANLRVLNLINNQLQELPVSLLKLTKLAALWLSDNQSQPLIPLQQDFNHEKSHMYLTCFMLPQQINTDVLQDSTENNNQNRIERRTEPVIQSGRRHICFAPESTSILGATQRLSRAPTPYPKELRALARHARSMQRGVYLSQSQQPESHKSQNEETAVMHGPNDVIEIKEAKVTYKNDQQQISKISKNSANCLYPNEIYANGNETEDHLLPDQQHNIYVSNTMNNDKSLIREAKFIRTEQKNTTKYQLTNNESDISVKTNEICDNHVPSLILPPPPPPPLQSAPPAPPLQQPPPYYIAAAQSLHAEYFNNLNKNFNRKSIDHNNSSDLNNRTSPLNDDLKLDNLSIRSELTTRNLMHELNSVDKSPTMFTQAKPLVGQHIVVPTPQRLHPISQICPSNEEIVKSPSLQITSADNSQCSSNDLVDSANTQSKSSHTKWLFGKHRNASVMQIQLHKNSNDVGFKITNDFNNGIFISEINYNGCAYGLLRPGDKILDLDNIDFTKVNLKYANEVLQSTGPTINIMISRI